MNRPHYKALYEESQEKLRYAQNQLNEARKLNSSVYAIKADYSKLYHQVTGFLSTTRESLLSPSVTKEGWLFIPALAPEDAHTYLTAFSKLSTRVNEKRPPIL
jgi:hypothetical protein